MVIPVDVSLVVPPESLGFTVGSTTLPFYSPNTAMTGMPVNSVKNSSGTPVGSNYNTLHIGPETAPIFRVHDKNFDDVTSRNPPISKGIAAMFAASAPVSISKAVPAHYVNFGLSDGIFGLPWDKVAGLGIVIGGTWMFHKIFSKAMQELEPSTEKSRLNSVVFSGLKWARRLLWGGATYLGFHLIGADPNSILISIGIPAAVVGFAVKDMLHEAAAYWAIVNKGNLLVGDRIKVGDVSGVVEKISVFSVVLKGVDKNGVEKRYYIPPSKIISMITEETDIDQDALDSIHLGYYVRIGEDVYGRVASKDDNTVGVYQEGPNGTKYIHYVPVGEIKYNSLIVYGKNPPQLPDNVSIGMRVNLANIVGVIQKYDDRYVWIKADSPDETANPVNQAVVVKKGIWRIPRSAFSSPWSIIDVNTNDEK